MAQPDSSQSASQINEFRLPNGSVLRRGSRIRVPEALIWDPIVIEASHRLGWELENGSASHGSEVIAWPQNKVAS